MVDSGIGIKNEHLEKVTSKFYRVDKNSWDNSMGLGLAMVKYVLKELNSSLEIRSQFGKGSTFSFSIKNTIMEKVVCQFSWYCDSSIKSRSINNAAYKESYEVAKKVLLEGFRLDIMKDALYYHANYVKPGWNLPKIGQIGNHIFYKEKERKNDGI